MVVPKVKFTVSIIIAKNIYILPRLISRNKRGEKQMQRKYLYAITAIVIIIIAAFAAYWAWQMQPTTHVTLDFWAPFSGEQATTDFWGNVSEAYKNQTGNTIRISMYSGDEFFTKLTTALGSGSPPDLFVTYGGGELDTYVNESGVADISNLFTESWAQSQIGAGVKDAITRNGKQYALPYELQTDWLFINRKVFENANVTIPTMDTGWTWDQFIAASNKIKAAGIAPVAMSGADSWSLSFPACYIHERANGANAFKDALTRTTNFTSSYAKAYSQLKQWVDGDYFQTGWATTHFYDAYQYFQAGDAAMFIQGTWAVGMVSDNANMTLDVVQWPYLPDQPTANKVIFGSSTNIAVAVASTHMNEAEDFLRFISKPEWQVKYAKDTTGPLAQTVTLPSGTYPSTMNTVLTAITNSPTLILRYGTMAPKDLGATIDEQNLLVFTGQKSPADAAATIEAKAVQVLGPVH
jgi:raffinose/stachyose/melibiose transport system substrate-binding protein